MPDRPRAPKREIVSWAMFDFANQAYTLLIITVVFAVVFPRMIVGDGPDYRLGNFLWSLALGISYLLTVLASPILGAIMDYAAMKKRFLFYSYILTVVSTAALYFASPGMIILSMILIIISNFGFAIGESFIASFLPELGPAKDLGKISGFGWAVGYIGGMISTVCALLWIGEVSEENFANLRYVGPLASAFFLFGAIPTFIWLKERSVPKPLPDGHSWFKIGYQRTFDTLKKVREFRDLAVFLLVVFFSMAGLSIIISFTFIYGDQVIRWDEDVRTLMFVITQVTAMIGAVLFGFLQDRIGAKLTFNLTLVLWIITIFLIYLTPTITSILNENFSALASLETQTFFLFVGSIAGLGLGSVQSASRTLVGLFSPHSKSAEFFGFWGFSTKLASVFGIIALGVMQLILGLHTAILICAVFFLLSLIGAYWVNEQRGIKVAMNYQEEKIRH
ncbi:MAG: MFS transporter [Oligoflexus sp.]